LSLARRPVPFHQGSSGGLDPHPVRNDNREGTPPLVRLKGLCGPGDQGEPVVTVMLPQED
jgi:hypothetical protein